MANYDAEVRVSTKVDTSQMQRLQLQIDKAVQKVDALTQKYDELKSKRLPTEAYTELESKLASAKAELTALIDQEEKFKSIGATTGGAWDTLIQKEADAQLKIESLNAEMQKLVDTGKDFTIGADPNEINDAANDLSRARSELRMLVTKQGELQAKSYKVSDSLKKVGTAGKKAFSSINGHIRKSSGMLGGFASRLKSIALSLLVFNWITKGFNAMVSGMKDGFKNLVQYSDEYNRSISSLQSANLQLKNSFAAAFAPIVQMVIPYLVQLIGYVTSAVNAFAQFIAVLGGKTTWTRATKVQQNYAASLNGTAAAAKKAAGALAAFDELDVLQKTESGTDGSGAGSIDPGSMFEEVPVGELTGFWKKLLDAIKNGDWYELGKFLGEQLKEALDNIPWDAIKEKARQVAQNLADLINGFVEVEGLGESIGRTLAEALNTALEFLCTFAKELHWDSVGRFIADGINGFFKNFDFALLAQTLNEFVDGIQDLIAGFFDELSWKDIFGGLIDFFSNLELDTIGLIIGLITIKKVGGFKISAKTVIEGIKNTVELALTGGISLPTLLITISSFLLKLPGTPAFDVIANQVIGSLDEAFSKAFPELSEWLGETLTGAVIGGVASAGNPIAVAIGAIIGGIPFKDYIFNFEWAKDLLDSMVESFKTAFDGNRKDIMDIGGYILEGIVEGLLAAAAFIIEPFYRIFELFYNAICDVFGIHSPAESMKPIGEYILLGIIEGFLAKIDEFNTAIQTWWDEIIAPWFTAEKWYELIDGIREGLEQLWNEICEWWESTAFVQWWEEYVSPWFTAEKWYSLAEGIRTGISNKWNELVAWWKTNITAWWTNHVQPWFTVEKWLALGENMKNGIFSGFKGLTNKVVDVLNDVISALEGMINTAIAGINSLLSTIGSSPLGEFVGMDFSIGNVSFGRIPHLATGAVIRGGNPFMAVLGDQPRGQTNIEAPLSTIEDAMRNVLSEKPVYEGTTEAEITLDGEAIGRLVLPYLMKEWERGGYSLDSL